MSSARVVNRWFIVLWCVLAGAMLALQVRHLALSWAPHSSLDVANLVLTALVGVAGPLWLRALRTRDSRDLRSRLEAAFEHFQTGILSTDDEGRVRYVNPALLEMIGARSEQIVGRLPPEFLPEDAAAVYARERARRVRGVYEPYRIQGRREDGESVTLQIVPAPLLSDDGRTIATLVIVNDVSEEERAARERRELEGHLRRAQRLEALGTLAGGIAHDFNNIFFAILGHAEMAEDATKEVSARFDLVQITKACERGRELVRQMLTFARTSDSERAPMDIVPLVKESAKLLASSAPAGVRVVTALDDELPLVDTHPAAVHQILMNMATNALQAVEQSGTISIELSSDRPSADERGAHGSLEDVPYLKLRVRDDGCGIAEEDIERLFDPFFTKRAVGTGSGMGLAVVHGIVEEHGGVIAVESEPGRGSAFTVFLPAVVACPESPRTMEDGDETGRLRVLLVDDEVTIVRLLSAMLESMGHEVSSFTCAEDALHALREAPGDYDLVITDQAMPTMSGLRMIEALRDAGLDLPVILATGSTPLPDRGRLDELKVGASIAKPMTLKELREGVAAALRAGAAAKEEAGSVR